MTISRAQMYRQLYQNGGNTLPIYPRIEAIETSLGGAEERIGDPALGQSSGSPLSNVYNNQTSGMSSIFGNTSGQQSSAPSPQLGILGIPGQGGFQPMQLQQPQQPQQSNVGVQLGTQPGFTIPPSNVGPNAPGIIPRDPGYGSGPIGTIGSGVFGPRGPRGTPFTPLPLPPGVNVGNPSVNRDYGFNQYGFDSSLLNYLNQQKQASYIDAGASYTYDPTTQTFSGGTMGAQYGNIPLSVLQQVATSGDRNLLQQYQTGGRGFNQPQQPGVQQPIPRDPGYGSGPIGTTGLGVFGPRGPRGTPLTPLPPGVNVGDPSPLGGTIGNIGEFGPRQYYEQTGQLPSGMTVGDPRLGAPFIPGNPLQEIMRGGAANGGRIGYQEGGMGMMPQQMESPEGIMSIMSPEAGSMPPSMQGQMQGQMMQGAGNEEQGQTALLTIIQLLIEKGVPPEQAEELAMQILQAFAQGGAPAVEEFANQLRQQEQSQAMASGGIVGYARRRNYGFGSFFGGIVDSIGDFVGDVVGGVGDIVSDIAQSPIGMIALSIAAPYALGAIFGPAFTTLGGTGFLGGALRAGISNLAVQGIATGKFDPKQALLASLAGGVTSGLTSGTEGINPDVGGIPDAMQPLPTPPPNVATNLAETFSTPNFQPNITPDTGYTGLESDISSAVGTGPNAAFTLDQATLDPAAGAGSQIYNPGVIQAEPNVFQQGLASIQNFGTNLMADPLGTLKGGFGSLYDYAKENAGPLSLGALAGASIRPQAPGESDEDYQRYLAEREAEVAQYYNLYQGYMNPKPPIALAANGGQITNRQNYFFGSKVSAVATPQSGGGTGGGGFMGGMMARLIQQNPQMFKPQGTTTSYENRYRDLIRGDFIDENRNGIDDRQEASYGGRIGYEYGSMPMGEPRRNPAGIMELDYRKKGGFVPPIGIKEKADDIPAMLSNNEFVFTANAVRNAGEGNVNKGAQRMYGLMKQLEAGGLA